MLFDHLVQSASTSFSGYYSASKGYNASLPTAVTRSTCLSSEDHSQSNHTQSESLNCITNIDFISFIASQTAAHDNSESMSSNLPLRSTDNIRKTLLPHRSRSTHTKAVFVVGPPGYPIVF